MKKALTLLLMVLLGVLGCSTNDDAIYVWHAYRGDEATALESLAQHYQREHGIRIELLAIPFGAYASKLESAIPHGNGPDLFIDAHERIGTYRRNGLIAPVGDALPSPAPFSEGTLRALTLDAQIYGVPLSTKSLALIVNTRFIPGAPATFESIVRLPMPSGVYPIAYEVQSAYTHAPFLHSFGGEMIGPNGLAIDSTEGARSFAFAKQMAAKLPPDPNGALVSQLFSAEKAASVIAGPWFLNEIPKEIPVAIYPLPPLEASGAPLRPYLTVEAAMLSPDGAKRSSVRAFARWLATDAEAIRVRATLGHQQITDSPNAIPMPTDPQMRAAWVPVEQALRKVIRGDASPEDALREAHARFNDSVKPPPPPPSPAPLAVVVGFVLLYLAWAAQKNVRSESFRREVRASFSAYAFVTHAFVIVGLLVVFPLLAGAATSFFAGPSGHTSYVGFGNYIAILTARGGPLLAHGSFYLTLLVTIVWTVINVALHLAIGLFLGVLLSKEVLRLRPVYRTLLILPWAVPSYVTALSWKGMFHRQFGAINAILAAFHVEPISWFSKFSTAFAANIATNVWLGFPFMMVVTMGALTSIPKDVLEAASIDGATPWQTFWRVTFPLLRPSLLPAVALGSVWTFNMFNVVFLVSEGEPDGTTDILVSDAYRWAFTRDAQYGYAAAYAVIIFGILFLSSRASEWISARKKNA